MASFMKSTSSTKCLSPSLPFWQDCQRACGEENVQLSNSWMLAQNSKPFTEDSVLFMQWLPCRYGNNRQPSCPSYTWAWWRCHSVRHSRFLGGGLAENNLSSEGGTDTSKEYFCHQRSGWLFYHWPSCPSCEEAEAGTLVHSHSSCEEQC